MQLARQGVAMKDGSFPIRNRGDLRNAIRAIGRARDPDAARRHIVARAKALRLTQMLPPDWGVTAGGQFMHQLAAAMLELGDAEVPGIYMPEELHYGIVATAAVAEPNIGLAPLMPPAEWFDDPGLDGPTPLTVTADGRVFGHLAEFGKCHRGIQGRCVMAPHTKNGYAHFNVGRMLTADGSQVEVGKLTVDAHHAPLTVGPQAAAAHYDHSGSVAAFVRAGEDQWGPWLAGATRSDATPEQIRDLRANPPSGDWRNTEGRGLELVAALAVPVPGFPVMAVTASLDIEGGEEPYALIMGYMDDQPLAIVAAGVYDESQHPRDPGGEGGGQWVAKGAPADASVGRIRRLRRPGAPLRPDAGPPEFPLSTGLFAEPLRPGETIAPGMPKEGDPDVQSFQAHYTVRPGHSAAGESERKALFATKEEAIQHVKDAIRRGDVLDYNITPSRQPVLSIYSNSSAGDERARAYYLRHRPRQQVPLDQAPPAGDPGTMSSRYGDNPGSTAAQNERDRVRRLRRGAPLTPAPPLRASVLARRILGGIDGLAEVFR